MHIPDGYLGPQTYVPALAVMAGAWAAGVARLRRTLRLREVPVLALGAAFSFVIMMFNVPIPGGTTGHAVGAVLIAILLGPCAAMIAVSLALVIQALLFGDGGITALGANCFNMAVVMPFIGWTVYRLVAGSSPVGSARQWLGAAAGAYLGLCAAAVAAGVELGIQPLIAHDAAGRALYCPFGLGLTVPVMALEHLLVFGFIEAIVTALVVAYLQRAAPELLAASAVAAPPAGRLRRLALALGVLVLLTPLGLYLPALFRAGSPWGEWRGAELKTEMTKAAGGRESDLPAGVRQAEARGSRALLPDYALPGQNSAASASRSFTYVLSGAIGVTVLGFLIMLGRKMLARKGDGNADPGLDA